MRKMSDYVDTNPPTTDTPNGTFKNETQPNACDGTDIKAEHMQDPYYALYQILQLAGEIPNGELENGNNSRQFLKSLSSIGWFKYDSKLEYKKNAIAIYTIDSTTKLYRSEKDNNNAPLTNTDYWVNILTINSDNTIELNSTSMDNATVFIGAFMYGIRNDTPEGWLRCDGTDKPAKAFMSFINNYLLSGKIPYKNLTDWQTEYNANNGNCGYFGYQEEILQYEEDEDNEDETSNNAENKNNKDKTPVLDEDGNPIVIQEGILRMPCFQDRVFIAQALNSGNISKFNLDQIVNITGSFCGVQNNTKNTSSGAFDDSAKISGYAVGGLVSVYAGLETFSASRVVRTGDRVQPQHIQYPIFICVSNKAVPVTEIQYNEFLKSIKDLNNKINISGSNITDNFYKKLLPNYNAIISIASNYTSEINGIIFGYVNTSRGAYQLLINGIRVAYTVFTGGNYGGINGTYYALIKKGDIIQTSYPENYVCPFYD